jgi:type II secretory ATPase GspE/PulE/Tfp pilus assembly ATPase PilB-like protein
VAERFYSTYQVAELLGTTPAAVREWIDRGRLPGQQFEDGSVRVAEPILVEFLHDRGIEIESALTRTSGRPGPVEPPLHRLLTGQPAPGTAPASPDELRRPGRPSPPEQPAAADEQARPPERETEPAPAAEEEPSVSVSVVGPGQDGDGEAVAHVRVRAGSEQAPQEPAGPSEPPQEPTPGEPEEAPRPAEEPRPTQEPEPAATAEEDPVRRLAEAILADAVGRGATAIHLEQQAGRPRLRLRIDGVMQEKTQFGRRLPAAVSAALPVELRAMAGLGPIGLEPQTGCCSREIEGRTWDFRLHACPMAEGERLVVSIVAPATQAGLMGLGLSEADLAALRRPLSEPAGLVLVTGPSRPQRRAMLRAMLNELNSHRRALLCLECEAEPLIEGVSHLHHDVGEDCGREELLAVVSGQDPDVVAVEDVGAATPAAVAVELSCDGRLALGGLAGRGSADALSALCGLSDRPIALAAGLLAVVESRTLRRLCPHCRTTRAADPELLARLGVERLGFEVAAGNGCSHCGGSGHRGTMTICSVIEADAVIAKLLRLGSDYGAFEQAIRLSGRNTLARRAVDGLARQQFSLEELIRVLPRLKLPVE